jgi:hypothetical protein
LNKSRSGAVPAAKLEQREYQVAARERAVDRSKQTLLQGQDAWLALLSNVRKLLLSLMRRIPDG